MTRYDDEYGPWTEGKAVLSGTPRARGMDPNFRGGVYRGERMQASQGGQATYGQYRLRHQHSLQGYGGYQGRYGGGGYDREYDRGYRPGHRERRTPRQLGGYDGGYAGYGQGARSGYDRELRQGSPGGLRGDAAYLRDFNKNSPTLRGEEGPQGPARRASGFADASPDPRQWRTGGAHRYDEEHDRYGGRSSAGFSEYWLPKQAPRGTPMPHRGGK